MVKLKTYSKKKPCYYCGALPPSLREHAPPQMMFNGFECDGITVSACAEHNNSKSGRDRAIVTSLARSMDQMLQSDHRQRPLSTNVQHAIELLSPNYRQANNFLALRPYLIDPPEGLDVALPYLEPDVQPLIWIKQLTAAIVWSATGYYDPEIDWSKAQAWSPHFVRVNDPISTDQALEKAIQNISAESTIDNNFTWWRGWSAKPRAYPSDIFHFQLSFVPHPTDWDGKQVIFKHVFYDSVKWYVLFAASTRTVEILQEAVGAKHLA